MNRRILTSLLLALVVCGLVWAQPDAESNQRSVEGVVVDANGTPIVRAVVQLKDTRTLQIRSFVSQDDGRYRFSGLRRDTDYELKATYQGKTSDTKRLTVFDNRPVANVVLRFEN